MVRKPVILVALATLLLAGCDELDIAGMFSTKCTNVRERFQQSMDYNSQHGYPTVALPRDDYRVYVCSDIHADGQARNLAEMIRRCNGDTLSRFYLLLGDLVNTTDDYSIFPSLLPLTPGSHPGEDTVFTIPGNHDNYFDRWPLWLDMFHRSVFYITAQTPHYRDLYIMLDICSGTVGSSQLEWLREVLEEVRPSCRHCVVCMHNNIFRTDHSQMPSSNLPLEETYALLRLFADSHVDLCLQGHDHYRSVETFEDVTYIDLDDIKDDSPHASYLTLDMGTDAEYAFVRLGTADSR